MPNTIDLNKFGFKKLNKFNVTDLRNKSHIEFNDLHNLEFHLKNAILQNKLPRFDKSVFHTLEKRNIESKPLSKLKVIVLILGNIKGVIKFRFKHSKSSFSRYKSHNYESIQVLLNHVFVKHNNNIYHTKNGFQRIELIQSINKLVQDIKEPKVLEAGCGSGINMYMLHSSNPNLNISGFEYTNSRLASAMVNLNDTQMLENLFLADVCNIDLPDNSFDIVYSYHVLEQLGQKNAEIALSEMLRVSKVGVVLSEPSTKNASYFEKWRMKTLGYCEDLFKVAKKLKNAEIVYYEEDKYRCFPNTSYHLILKKI